MKLTSLALIATALVCSGASPEHSALIQVTHNSNVDYGDPSPPIFSDSKVTVISTNGLKIVWASEAAFFAGKKPETEILKICHSDGTQLSDDAGEDIWDPTLDGETLLGSVMVPPPDRKNAKWPDDAPSRRTFRFRLKNKCWTRDPKPLWKGPSGWLGHTYGHATHEGWLFYERVAEVRDGVPWTTNLYARKGRKEILVLDARKWPSARRASGGTLVEGARPFKIGRTYFISFSAGDYNSPNYGIHLLRASKIEGPYSPVLNKNETDLKDFGKFIEQKIEMTWGAGRGVFFERNGQWWILFHGIPAPFDGTDGHRRFYLAPANRILSE